MKITKRQLRQIIKEEKQKILREAYDVDDYPYERKVELFDTAVDSIQSIITMERNAFAQGHQGALEGIEYLEGILEQLREYLAMAQEASASGYYATL